MTRYPRALGQHGHLDGALRICRNGMSDDLQQELFQEVGVRQGVTDQTAKFTFKVCAQFFRQSQDRVPSGQANSLLATGPCPFGFLPSDRIRISSACRRASSRRSIAC